MSKSMVTRLFVGGIVAILAGAVLAFGALLVAFAAGAVAIGGPALVEVHGGPLVWTLAGLAIALVAIVGGWIAALLSWIGALLNTVQLEDRTWFALLLVLGLFSFGFVAMIAYVVAGPDATDPGPARPGVATTPGT